MNPNTICVGCMEQDSGEPICSKCGRPLDMESRNSLQLKPRTLLRDQYLIGRALGHGGFGITYLAYDLGLETRLAIKEYIPNGVAGRSGNDTKVHAYSDQTQPEFEWGLERFLEEARVLKKFHNHAGIVRIDTAFRDNGTAYLVMEFLDGMTFDEFLSRREGRITMETALRVMLPVIDALRDVHAEGILHRDISPDNIYLSKTGLVKLIDFGAARNALSQKSKNLSIILKEGYAPEEQYRSSGIQGPWTDVYATAATLYRAITGILPQPSLDRQAEDLVQWPSQIGVEIDPRAEAALMKALTVRSTDRFQSMEDFKAALTGVGTGATRGVRLEDAAAGAPPAFRPPPPAPPMQASMQPPMQAPPPPPAYTVRPMSQPGYPQGPGGYVPPPPPPAPYMPAPSQNRWMWPAILGIAAMLSIAAVVIFKPTDDGKKKEVAVDPDDKNKSGKSDGGGGTPKGGGVIDTGGGGSTSGGGGTNTGGGGTSSGGGTTSGGGGSSSGGGGTSGGGGGSTKGGGTTSGGGGTKGGGTTSGGGSTSGGGGTGGGGTSSGGGGTTTGGGGTTTGGGGTTTTGGGGVAASGYEGLIQEARQTEARNPARAAQILNQAIQSDPNKPEAYDLLAEIQLYQLRELGPAVQNYKKSLAHGGQATFHVYHDHGGSNFTRNCRGWLRVSAAGVSFEAFDSLHKFSSPRAQVFEARKNRWQGGGIFTGNGTRATVDPNAFHVRLQSKDGPNYNLAPMSAFGDPERELILDIIGGR